MWYGSKIPTIYKKKLPTSEESLCKTGCLTIKLETLPAKVTNTIGYNQITLYGIDRESFKQNEEKRIR